MHKSDSCNSLLYFQHENFIRKNLQLTYSRDYISFFSFIEKYWFISIKKRQELHSVLICPFQMFVATKIMFFLTDLITRVRTTCIKTYNINVYTSTEHYIFSIRINLNKRKSTSLLKCPIIFEIGKSMIPFFKKVYLQEMISVGH